MSENGFWQLFTKTRNLGKRRDIRPFDSRSDAIRYVKDREDMEYDQDAPGTMIGETDDRKLVCVKYVSGAVVG